MKKSLQLSFLFLVSLSFSNLFANQISSSLSDENKIWMPENLNVITFRNGDTITEIKDNKEWEQACNKGLPAWCYYNNEATNEKKHGKLYNWFALNDSRGLAPEGWRIAKAAEFSSVDPSQLTNQLGGFRNCYGAFHNIDSQGYWWSAEDNDGSNSAWGFTLDKVAQKAKATSDLKGCGMTVRCIKEN